MPFRGEIYWMDFGTLSGSEPGFRRPVVVIQDDRFNRSAISTCIVAALTSNIAFAQLPGNVFVPALSSGLGKDSVINVSQVATVDRDSLGDPLGRVADYLVSELDAGLRLVLSLATGTR